LKLYSESFHRYGEEEHPKYKSIINQLMRPFREFSARVHLMFGSDASERSPRLDGSLPSVGVPEMRVLKFGGGTREFRMTTEGDIKRLVFFCFLEEAIHKNLKKAEGADVWTDFIDSSGFGLLNSEGGFSAGIASWGIPRQSSD